MSNPLRTLLFLGAAGLAAQDTPRAEVVDLPTVLKLAGAQAIEVQLAEARLSEARANSDGADWALFPTISPGIGYRKHSGQLQDIVGQVSDITKESVTAGATLSLSLELGEAVYRRLAARQTERAAEHQLEAQRRQSVALAAVAYFDLARSTQAASLLTDAVRTARGYREQLAQGVAAGLTFKGDELRAAGHVSRFELRLRQALEQQRQDAARLAHALRLDIAVALQPAPEPTRPLQLTGPAEKLDDQVRLALNRRPELQAAGALREAAASRGDAATYAPLYPTLGAQVFAGGLGGSASSARRDFDNSTDTFVTLSWKIGAGGLFDGSRVDGARARQRQTDLEATRVREEIVRQVVDAQAGVTFAAQRLEIAAEAVRLAETAHRLTLSRKDLAVGAVLETLLAQQDLIQARLDQVETIAEWNKAQYRLRFATGE